LPKGRYLILLKAHAQRVADTDLFLRGFSLGPSQHGPYPGVQLGLRERFEDIIIRSDIEAGDFVRFFGFGGKNDDGNGGKSFACF
jgi:hypothetical protein